MAKPPAVEGLEGAEPEPEPVDGPDTDYYMTLDDGDGYTQHGDDADVDHPQEAEAAEQQGDTWTDGDFDGGFDDEAWEAAATGGISSGQ